MAEIETDKAAYEALRRVPPKDVESHLYDAIRLSPDLADTLLTTVDIPLKLMTDSSNNSKFIACEFNRDLDSYRSPHSNKYFPPIPDGQMISPRLRNIEQRANVAFNAYRHLYFQGGVSSVYCWEIDTNIFGFGVFIKNEVQTTLRTGETVRGCIDCTDVIEVDESNKSKTMYTMTSSVLMNLEIDMKLGSPFRISGSTANRKARYGQSQTDDDHIVNIGSLVESNSTNFRDLIENMFIGKMKQILDIITINDGVEIQKKMAEAFKLAADNRN